MNPFVAHMVKHAGWSPAKARAVEAIVGSALGGGVGAGAGAVIKDKDRVQGAKRGALIGAGAGGVGALGGSAILAHHLNKSEARALKEVTRNYLEGLGVAERSLASRPTRDLMDAHLALGPFHGSVTPARNEAERQVRTEAVESYLNALSRYHGRGEQLEALRGSSRKLRSETVDEAREALNVARQRRSSLPFRGMSQWQQVGKNNWVPAQHTHPGVLAHHFAAKSPEAKLDWLYDEKGRGHFTLTPAYWKARLGQALNEV